jgi:hypothetical protein
MTMPFDPSPLREGFMWGFRPPSYFAPKPGLQELLSTVKGTARRFYIEFLADEGRLDEILPESAGESLGEPLRRAMGRIHPRLMGGEYLPNRRPGEVEIARIELASVTGDVTSVRARPAGERIAYRIVDEYSCEFTCKPRSTRQPLTLDDLVKMIDNCNERGGPVFGRAGALRVLRRVGRLVRARRRCLARSMESRLLPRRGGKPMNDLEFALDAIAIARAEIASNVEYVRDHLHECAIPEGFAEPIEDLLAGLEDAERGHQEDFTALSSDAGTLASEAAKRIDERFMRAFTRMHEVLLRLDEYSDTLAFGLVWMLLKESATNMLHAWLAMRDALAQCAPAGKENA